MRIRLVAVGKIKEKYLHEGLREYTKRLGAYARFEAIEVADEKVPDQPSPAEAEAIKAKEGSRLLAAAGFDAGGTGKAGKASGSMAARSGAGTIGVALDLRGAMWSSEDLAKHLAEWGLYGTSSVVFFIGGTLGLSDEVLAACKYRWCLSKLTFPHQLARLVVLEQVYRGFKIGAGETYHR
ncbi:23S rRNA (pseudouridine(1915)-N(3))-methyltransferase RlmH [Heliophilum fasciatum]|uniref:Ribosomal RNA large subunit methyltransferase H n=1 Tax=Heliophilum fasciatum TaxID=35700 RepID=A0A4R2REU0_9FIRM|nr:23S rRNA (pseudouridine(1915)-N(3))-methyltransferase RlmH [Heliophilum fasciatum]MCW2279348.1 23S rRNA (pseudouridine1915-N3)-methyltransferase [Heliophilum fasciatum]TCP60779.1 23S rRNA (pseudouridine1915-N3)-methyltransferase [Heliophilum fasciatum]